MILELSKLIPFNTHAHTDGSNFRLKDSIMKVEQLVDISYAKGHNGVCLTDHETVSMHIRMMQYVEEQKKKQKLPEDFVLALGNEIYLVDSIGEVREGYKSGITKFPHFVLIAKNKDGHKQIRQLSSKAWLSSFRTGQMERVPTTKEEMSYVVEQNKGNLIATTACAGGEFLMLINMLLSSEPEMKPTIKQTIHAFVSFNLRLFGEDFYIEIQPTIDPQLKLINTEAIRIAKAYKIKWTFATDAHYQTKDRRGVHESFLNSKEGERELSDFYATTYIMTTEEMWEYFKDYISEEDFIAGMKVNQEIRGKIESYTLQHEVVVPEIHLEKFELNHLFLGYYGEYEYISNFANSEYEQDRWFLKMIEDGFIKKNQEFNEENLNRINTELKELWLISTNLKQRLSSYYNLVEHIVDLMWDEKRGNSLVGIARGSVTGYYTCYLIGITQMNPIQWDLPHWRHLESTRPELPDIDLDTEAKKRQGIFESCRKDVGFDRFLNIITFKTEGSKSACLTACRGLGMNSDDAQFLADMIPFERGANWPLHDCFFGNEELEREPIVQFFKEIENHENLKDIMLSIEGLIVGRSIHASGSYIFDKGYIEQNALMKAPNGSYVTQWNMKDSDWCGGLKVDLLTIEALDKIRTCLELLLKHGKIEWQGTWRSTYDKYIHPDVIDYDSPEMWEMIANNQVDSLFQFVTTIGLQTAKEVKPTTLTQLADANSLMRLMADESGVSPVEIYVKYKRDIGEWYEELKYHNLNQIEVEILEKHLLKVFGVSGTQEEIMILVMDKNVSNFSLAEANGLRKAIAKKNKKALETTKELFFRKGLECGSRQQLLDYVWNVQIKRQLGYSFSKNHTYPYSNIAIQELNLAYHHNSLFWNCSCLTIDSGGSVEEFEYERSESEAIVVEDDEDEDEVDSHEKTTNYGKLASAIGKMQDRNVKIALPDINRSQLSFFPDEEENEIIFGLKGIVGVSDDVSNDIIANRPFKNLEDFYNRMTLAKKDVVDGSGKTKKISLVSTGKLITLIKGGAFDKLENKPRHEIMRSFIALTSPDKKNMTLANVDAVVGMGIVPEHLNTQLRIHKFKSFVTDKTKVAKDDEKTKSKKWFRVKGATDSITAMANLFFEDHFISSLVEDRDYYYDEDGSVCILSGASSCEFDKVVALKTAEFKQWLSSPDCLDRFNEQTYKEKWGNLLKETTSQWEMDSLSFYYGEHELAHVDLEHYGISNFFELPDVPVETGEFSKYKDRLYPKFELTRICGTVLDKNKYKHTVSLLTPHGVILVKFQSGAFSHYDKTISMVDSEGSKTRVESGWLSRGNKLLITGFRRGEQFRPKKYRDSIQQHTLSLIEEVTEDGKLLLKTERSRV